LPGEADPWREADVAEAPALIHADSVRLARALEDKLEQGYAIESESDTQAILVMKGRRRWFGLSNAPSVRYEVTVDEGGSARSRRL
jgi:hypothetical protein